MHPFLIACRLALGPPGKLPAWGGLLDAAEEQGLWSFSFGPEGVRPLPEGMLWGRFDDAATALKALELALAEASDLLGYPVRAQGRVACALAPRDSLAPQISIADSQALK